MFKSNLLRSLNLYSDAFPKLLRILKDLIRVKYDLIPSDEMMETVKTEFELQMFASEERND